MVKSKKSTKSLHPNYYPRTLLVVATFGMELKLKLKFLYIFFYWVFYIYSTICTLTRTGSGHGTRPRSRSDVAIGMYRRLTSAVSCSKAGQPYWGHRNPSTSVAEVFRLQLSHSSSLPNSLDYRREPSLPVNFFFNLLGIWRTFLRLHISVESRM